MHIKELLNGVDVLDYFGNENLEVTGVTGDSRLVKQGNAFLCIKGTKYDANDFIGSAHDNGAILAIVEEEPSESPIPYILVSDTRLAASYIFSNLNGRPQNSMKMIGITGTNGKTSTTYILSKIFENAGYKTGIIGTIANKYGNKTVDLGMTTPDPERLYRLLADMRDDGVEVVLMEVSSHSLALGRVAPIIFSAALYTNLTQDHLDFHKTMENYAQAKEILFKQSDFAVFNVDNEYVKKTFDKRLCKSISFSESNDSDFKAVNIEHDSMNGVEYDIQTRDGSLLHISCKIPGTFSVYNTLGSAALALSLGINQMTIRESINQIENVPGRIERITDNSVPFSVVIDYAHTPDAITNIIESIKESKRPDQKITVLFGCGGDRDKSKRPIMGSIATEMADFAIITSDNCRTEEPSAIISEILTGIQNKNNYIVIEDRKKAIEYAILNAKDNDIIIIAGKGHENYEIRKDGKHPFSEKDEVNKALKKRFESKK